MRPPRSVPDRALACQQNGERTGSRPSAAAGGGAPAPALRPADHRATSNTVALGGTGWRGCSGDLGVGSREISENRKYFGWASKDARNPPPEFSALRHVRFVPMVLNCSRGRALHSQSSCHIAKVVLALTAAKSPQRRRGHLAQYPAVSSIGSFRTPAPVCAAPPSWGRHPQTFTTANSCAAANFAL